MKTNEEREKFIEIIWHKRDPDPDTAENEYREAYYERLAYVNEHSSSGIPGYKTDRGRIYLKYGKPDEIDSHPAGGRYEREASEGGGSTSTYPFERWFYRKYSRAVRRPARVRRSHRQRRISSGAQSVSEGGPADGPRSRADHRRAESG